MSKFCFKCGSKLDDDAIFCGNCGIRQEESDCSINATTTEDNITSVPKKEHSDNGGNILMRLSGLSYVLAHKGRIGRQDFMIANVILIVASYILGEAFDFIFIHDWLSEKDLFTAWILFCMCPLFFEAGLIRERFNDLNFNGRIICILYIIPGIFFACIIGELNYLSGTMWASFFDSEQKFYLVLMIYGALCLLLQLILCFIKGTDGPNEYGDDPLIAKNITQ